MAQRDTKTRRYKKIVAELIKMRKQAGLTQSDVAEALKTDQSQISKIERCERRLDIVDYDRYCRSIGVDPGEPLRLSAPPQKPGHSARE